jgi:hypothetical protein
MLLVALGVSSFVVWLYLLCGRVAWSRRSEGRAPLHRSGCDKAAQREHFEPISRRAFVHCHEIV